MIAELEVVPRPVGTDETRYAHVDAAITALAASGLTYEVGALGTTIEGPPDAVWAALRSAHEATLTSGADAVISVVKLAQARDEPGPSMTELVADHRS